MKRLHGERCLSTCLSFSDNLAHLVETTHHFLILLNTRPWKNSSVIVSFELFFPLLRMFSKPNQQKTEVKRRGNDFNWRARPRRGLSPLFDFFFTCPVSQGLEVRAPFTYRLLSTLLPLCITFSKQPLKLDRKWLLLR